jgi:hypothetical protein
MEHDPAHNRHVFDARARGELPTEQAAAIRQFLANQNLVVVERIPPGSLYDTSELDYAPADSLITKEVFYESYIHKNPMRGAKGKVWVHFIRGARDNSYPLDLKRTDGDRIGVTYESAAQALACTRDENYTGRKLSLRMERTVAKALERYQQDN